MPQLSYQPLTAHQRQLVVVATRCCRALTQDQIVDHDFGCSSAFAHRCLRALVRADWLQQQKWVAELPPTSPQRLIRWAPGDRLPAFGRCAYQLRTSGRRPSQRLTIYSSTRRARDVLAGRCALKRTDQLGHDLALSSVYLKCGRPVYWLGEDQFAADREPHELLEDARIQVPGEPRPRLLIEWATPAYDKDRLQAFHEYAASWGCPYEIWGDVPC